MVPGIHMIRWQYLLSPAYVLPWMEYLTPFAYLLATVLLIFGYSNGLYYAPTDAVQGEVYRIIYLHVPAAFLSLAIYFSMAVMGVVFWVWHVKLADAIAAACAPVGLCMCSLALFTGSMWGKPTWGTYWLWDARMTSEALLWLLYLAQIILRQTIQPAGLAKRFCAIFSVVGAFDLPFIHFSVQWWHTLHQGSTLLRSSGPSINHAMLQPLLYCGFGMAILSACLVSRHVSLYFYHERT